MIIEIRAKSIEEAKQLLKSSANVIAIGNENCVRKIPDYNDICQLVLEAQNQSKKIRVVYPKIPNKYFEEIGRHFSKIANLDIDITLNDYGLIHEAGKYELKNGFAVGRNLAFTILASPWYEMLVSEENNKMQIALAASNMESKHKLSYIKKMGGNAIEIEGLPEMWGQTKVIRKNGFSVHAHQDYCLVAFSRCCPILKMNNSCSGCNNVYTAEIDRKFVSIPVQDKAASYKEATHYVKDKKVKALCPQLYFLGNGLYRKNLCRDVDDTIISSVIFTQNFYNKSSEMEDQFELYLRRH